MAEDALTLRDLVATASLETEVLAGEGGLWRSVLWAHSCELTEPWRWLGPSELLMTVGLCIPIAADEQVEFVRSIADAGLAGLMLGQHETCPPISKEMLAEANRLDLPVLSTAPEIPFAAVTRHIAAASSTRQTMEVLTLAKLYNLAAESSEDLLAFAEAVSRLLRIGIRVTDNLTAIPLVEQPGPYSVGANAVRSHDYPLRASEPATLEIEEAEGEDLSSLVLVHLIKLFELNAERVYTRSRYAAGRRSLLFEGLLRGAHDEAIETFLADARIGDGYRIVAVSETDFRKVRQAVSLRELPILTTKRGGNGYVLVQADFVSALRHVLAELTVSAGASAVLTDPRDVSTAASQARDALGHQTGDSLWHEYRGVPVSVLARSYEEATEIVARVLGDLASDEPKMNDLRETLFTYLRLDRSWNTAAAELGIHRQTLAYRIKKIEATTGLSLGNTADLAALWIAYRAWIVLHD